MRRNGERDELVLRRRKIQSVSLFSFFYCIWSFVNFSWISFFPKNTSAEREKLKGWFRVHFFHFVNIFGEKGKNSSCTKRKKIEEEEKNEAKWKAVGSLHSAAKIKEEGGEGRSA